MAKGYRVSVRVGDELGSSFQESLGITGLGETQFINQAIEAFVQYVREHGEITIPLAIVPRSSLKKALPPGEASRLIEPGEAASGLNERPSEEPPRPITKARAALRDMGKRESKK